MKQALVTRSRLTTHIRNVRHGTSSRNEEEEEEEEETTAVFFFFKFLPLLWVFFFWMRSFFSPSLCSFSLSRLPYLVSLLASRSRFGTLERQLYSFRRSCGRPGSSQQALFAGVGVRLRSLWLQLREKSQMNFKTWLCFGCDQQSQWGLYVLLYKQTQREGEDPTPPPQLAPSPVRCG